MGIGTWTCATYFTAFKFENAFRHVNTHLERYGQILHIDLAVQIGGTTVVGGHSVAVSVSVCRLSRKVQAKIHRWTHSPQTNWKGAKTRAWVMLPLNVSRGYFMRHLTEFTSTVALPYLYRNRWILHGLLCVRFLNLYMLYSAEYRSGRLMVLFGLVVAVAGYGLLLN